MTRELEIELLKKGIEILDREHSSLSGCFETAIEDIEVLVRPEQEFASVLFSKYDKQQHKNTISRFSTVQSYLTQLKNRCSHVQTLTTGPAIVFGVRITYQFSLTFCLAQRFQ